MPNDIPMYTHIVDLHIADQTDIADPVLMLTHTMYTDLICNLMVCLHERGFSVSDATAASDTENKVHVNRT
jgi:hypothetical protein